MKWEPIGKNNKGLGRGLSALMGEGTAVIDPPAVKTAESTGAGSALQTLPVNMLIPGSFQPRQLFNEESLHELAESILQNGIVQPIMVRPAAEKDKYEIIAGERRWRASKIAGLEQVPVIIKVLDDKAALEHALIENVQRQDLTPIEEAKAYEQLLEEFSYTQEQIAQHVGKSRSHITNLLRLLSLPESVKARLNDGSLSMGHARTLVGQENAEELAEKIVKEGLSVRQAEKLLRANKEAEGTASKKTKAAVSKEEDEDIVSLEKSLSENLGMKVTIDETAQGGKVTIYFHNLEQLDSILQRLSGNI